MLPGATTAIVISAVVNSQKRTPNISASTKKLIKFDKKLIENSFLLSLKKEAEVFLSYVWLMLSVREVLNFIYNPTLHID